MLTNEDGSLDLWSGNSGRVMGISIWDNQWTVNSGHPVITCV